MKYIYTEKLVLTKEEVTILDKARDLLDNIFIEAKKDGDIEDLARTAFNNICDLLTDDYSEME